MRQTTALLWKEWRELRAFLFIGLFVFLGLPLIGEYQAMLFNPRHPFQPVTVPWIFALGGVLAVFMGTAATCRDLRDDLRIFWISRAVSPVRWLAVKHAVAIAILMAVCTVPLLVELATTRDPDPMGRFLLALNPFLLLAIYGTASLFGCLVRRVAQAAMLSIAACLLLYCLPYVVPPLEAMSLSVVMDPNAQQALGKGPAYFVVGMLAVGLVTLVLSVLAVYRDWHVHADRKVIYWSVGLAGLLIVVTAAFQVGANLPIQQELPVPQGRQVIAMHGQGDRGVLVLSGRQAAAGPLPHTAVCSFHIDGTQIRLGPVIELSEPARSTRDLYFGYRVAAFDDRQGGIVYLTSIDIGPGGHRAIWSLLTVRLDGRAAQPVQRLELDSLVLDEAKQHEWFDWPSLWIAGDRLVAVSESSGSIAQAPGLQRVAVLSIDEPLHPRLVSLTSGGTAGWGPWAYRFMDPEETLWLGLPKSPALSREQRLNVALSRWDWPRLDRETVIARTLASYRLRQLDDDTALLDRTAAYKPSPIDRVLLANNDRLVAGDQRVYTQPWGSPLGNPVVSVFDATDPARLRRVGHFAAPSEARLSVHPLPDGRALIAGDKLYLVGAPRR